MYNGYACVGTAAPRNPLRQSVYMMTGHVQLTIAGAGMLVLVYNQTGCVCWAVGVA